MSLIFTLAAQHTPEFVLTATIDEANTALAVAPSLMARLIALRALSAAATREAQRVEAVLADVDRIAKVTGSAS